MNKPKDIEDYKTWLLKELNVRVTTRHKTQYGYISDRIKSSLECSPFWKEILGQMERLNNDYFLKTGYYLFIPNFKPELLLKEFDSFFEKTFRKNVLYNKKWPEPPNNAWVVPDNWYETINDIVRTCFVVKYLDGVEFLVGKIKEIGTGFHLNFKEYYEAREEGYYAVHLYAKCKFEIPRETWDTEEKEITFEIQITTQLQDVIRKLTHKYYETRRTKTEFESKKWQWNYETEEFASNYLGHILHYVEGMIMEIRKKQKQNEKTIY